MLQLNIKDTFNKELPADPNKNNTRRQVFEATHSYVTPRRTSKPQVIHVAKEVVQMIGLSKEDIQSEEFRDVFSGNKVLENTNPYAMCYGGHQFGNWAGQLGDGRAINLMEVKHDNQSWTLQLKGAGETPYSRTADGLAVLRSSIREHLCSEAMYYLGVPTTRSLSLSLTGDEVLRDMMYDGNSAYEKGAVVCRVAPSFIRFGNFQIFAARKDIASLKKLTDYTIKHFFPSIKGGDQASYLDFLREVSKRSLEMVIHWQRVGFVHGVMNTDNMSILGLTIDYGPYGWLEGYEPDWTPNTTDRGQRRYRYAYQPLIVHWNLYQLANALYPLIEDVEPLEAILNEFKEEYEIKNLEMMRQKIGLYEAKEDDNLLIDSLLHLLPTVETDMTIFFRNLANLKKEMNVVGGGLELIKDAFYDLDNLPNKIKEDWEQWMKIYQKRLKEEEMTDQARKEKMNLVNPKYVLRNYMAQLAIDAANKGDYSIVEELYELLKKPYDEQIDKEKWFAKRPEWARHKVGCSMLSCSS